MSLLQRLVNVDTSQPGQGAVPRFYATRAFRWQLDLNPDGVPLVNALTPLADRNDPARRNGVVRHAPNLKRSSGYVPQLGADDVQYVLGWADETTRPERTAGCLQAFIAAVEDWAARSPDDPAARAVLAFYRTGRNTEIEQPEVWSSKDPVLITVAHRPVIDNPSLQQAWEVQALARKAGTAMSEQVLCLVCAKPGRPLERLLQGLPKRVVPGASQDVAVLSVNLPIFGHTFAEGLKASPICDRCGEQFVEALRAMASYGIGDREIANANRRYGTLHYPGQGSRLVWWVIGDSEFDFWAIERADATSVQDLARRVERYGVAPTTPLDVDRFCALAFSGSSARLAIQAWIDRPLPEIERNVHAWFTDHAIQPVNDQDSPYASLYRLVRALGRWHKDSNGRQAYAAPKQGKDPYRPIDAQQRLLDSALLGKPLPASMLAHLTNRIRADRRIDKERAALLRLLLTRQHTTNSPENTMPTPGPGLDETVDDPAYIAGRVMAVLGSIQWTASRARNRDSNGVGTTFEDRYLSGAIANPAVAIVQGRQQAIAWLRKLRTTGRQGAAILLEKRLNELFDRFDALTGMPKRLTVDHQARFILGYHHQRTHDIRAGMAAKAAGNRDIPELPETELEPTQPPVNQAK